MSEELVRRIDRTHPELLQTNTDATCYAFCGLVMDELKASGRSVARISKSPGESQYVPPGFKSRAVTGRDGKVYVCSGVSHDAIYVDGRQVDLIGGANDSNQSIGKPGTPHWDEIDPAYYRPNNVPLVDAPAPPAPVPDNKAYPGDAAFDLLGTILEADYSNVGRSLDAQSVRWVGRVVYDWLSGTCPSLESSINKHRAEWRQALGINS